jgi:hypothetical protein
MAHVDRKDLLDFLTYDEQRAAIRLSAMAAKDLRRVHLGEHLCFLFENVETLRYQVLEMMRLEKMVREKDIRHELDTYNALLGGPGELGCTLLIEIEDEQARPELLRQWRDLPRHLFLECTDGSRAEARFDGEQMSDDKLSSVQFLKFQLGAGTPAALVCTLPGIAARTPLAGATREALMADLQASAL